MSSSNCCSLISIQISQEAVKWSDITIFLRTVHSSLWSTQSKALALVNEAEVDVLPEFSCFFYDPLDFGNLSLVPVYFLNPAWISRGSGFTYFWSLAWRILSITLLACEMGAILWYFLTFFVISLLWNWNENGPFPVLRPLLSFPNLLAYWVQHFHSIILGFELEFHRLH